MYLRKSAPRLGNFVEIIATPQYTKYKIQIYDTPIFEIHEVLLFQKGSNLGYVPNKPKSLWFEPDFGLGLALKVQNRVKLGQVGPQG